MEDAAKKLGTSADTKDKDTAYGHLAAANAQLEDANKMGETTDAEKAAKEQAIKDAKKAIALAEDEIVRAQASYDGKRLLLMNLRLLSLLLM